MVLLFIFVKHFSIFRKIQTVFGIPPSLNPRLAWALSVSEDIHQLFLIDWVFHLIYQHFVICQILVKLIPTWPRDNALNGVVKLILLFFVIFIYFWAFDVLIHYHVLIHDCLAYYLGLTIQQFEAILRHLTYLTYPILLVTPRRQQNFALGLSLLWTYVYALRQRFFLVLIFAKPPFWFFSIVVISNEKILGLFLSVLLKISLLRVLVILDELDMSLVKICIRSYLTVRSLFIQSFLRVLRVNFKWSIVVPTVTYDVLIILQYLPWALLLHPFFEEVFRLIFLDRGSTLMDELTSPNSWLQPILFLILAEF